MLTISIVAVNLKLSGAVVLKANETHVDPHTYQFGLNFTLGEANALERLIVKMAAVWII